MISKEEVELYKEEAVRLHDYGCNCAQSVACALSPEVGADDDVLFRCLEGFGAGMGGFTETCGAISGGVALAGIANSAGFAKKGSKESTYNAAKRIVADFQDKNGSTLCKDLKGFTSADGKPLRSCQGCIEDAVELTCKVLNDLEVARAAKK